MTKERAIEAKYNQEFNEKQLKIFNSIKSKKKVIARGYEFFIENREKTAP